MLKSKEWRKTTIIVSVFILIAWLCRFPPFHLSVIPYIGAAAGLSRPLIYIGLYIAWSIHISKVVINERLKKYLQYIAYLGILWLSIRTIKFELTVRGDSINFFLQYAYYIPSIFVPTLAMLSALYVRRGERYELPRAIKSALIGVSTALCIFVMTNPLHLMFWGAKDGVLDPLTYTLMPGYYIVYAWIIALTFISIAIIIAKSGISNRKRASVYPIAILIAIVIYNIVQFCFSDIWRYFSSDATTFHCLSIMGLIESCIITGLIPSNLAYEKVFAISPTDLVITDDDYNVRYAPKNFSIISKDTLRAASKATVQKDQNTVLKGHDLVPGYAIWQEDVSDITSVIASIQKTNEELSAKNELEKEINQAELDLQKALENNRLYDLSQKTTAGQNAKLSEILSRYFSETEYGKRKELLAKAAVFGAYIKRRGNLIFSAEKNGTVASSELLLCFEESQRNVELLGIECFSDISLSERTRLSLESASRIYDLYETLIEKLLTEMDSVFVRISETEEKITASYSIGTKNEISEIGLPTSCEVEKENHSLSVKLTLPKGGGIA